MRILSSNSSTGTETAGTLRCVPHVLKAGGKVEALQLSRGVDGDGFASPPWLAEDGALADIRATLSEETPNRCRVSIVADAALAALRRTAP